MAFSGVAVGGMENDLYVAIEKSIFFHCSNYGNDLRTGVAYDEHLSDSFGARELEVGKATK